jgi:hypothetical protein
MRNSVEGLTYDSFQRVVVMFICLKMVLSQEGLVKLAS